MELKHDSDLRFAHEWSQSDKSMSFEDYIAMRRRHVLEDSIDVSKRFLHMCHRQRKQVSLQALQRQIRLENDARRMAAGEIPYIGHVSLLAETYWTNRRKVKNAIHTPRTP